MSAPLRVLVCGGRDYTNHAHVFAVMDEYAAKHIVALVISGGARGADSIATEWAVARGVAAQVFPANWILHGRKAGPIRNQQMLDDGKPDVVIAFPGGIGTNDMKTRAANRDIPIVEVGAT